MDLQVLEADVLTTLPTQFCDNYDSAVEGTAKEQGEVYTEHFTLCTINMCQSGYKH